MKYTLKRILPHVHTLLESVAIINLKNTFNDNLENILLPNIVIIIRKHSEGPGKATRRGVNGRQSKFLDRT
jgi:hypothetical protein